MGVPRQLAYKLDSLIVNKVLDNVTKPLTRKGGRRAVPEYVELGSMNKICKELGHTPSGNMRRQIREAFDANIGTTIKAQITYKGHDGNEKSLKATFSRYAVVERGESLPSGEMADSTYIVFNPVYREVLNNAPLRPLDWEYMKDLPPRAQRFYEIISVRMLVAIRYKHREAKIPYSEFCMLAAQPRLKTLEAAHSQMSKIHKPHVKSGYIKRASFSSIESSDDLPDWLISYVPGPRAEAEYRTFTNQNLIDSSAIAPKQLNGASPKKKIPRVSAQKKLDSLFEKGEPKERK
jgi:hypothetical protein